MLEDFFRDLFGLSRKKDGAASSAGFLRAAGETEPERKAEVSVIVSCRQRFEAAPRGCRPDDRVTISPQLERLFVKNNDRLLRILRDQDALLAGGRVVWGHLVQVNNMLFNRQNRLTCPGNVIYSTDTFFDGRLALLSSMARNLFAQKGSRRADPELQQFVDAITNEYARVLRRKMPLSYTGDRSVYFATCLFQPGHLPFGYLKRSSFPVIVNPEETPAMMLLPVRFWPPELISQWRE